MSDFVDKAKILIRAGDGGAGAISFHREKYVAAGGPDGGDGGRGGDVAFVADTHLSSLIGFRYKKRYFAQNGQPGGPKKCFGKSAPTLVIKVPRGTVVREVATGRVLADISSTEPVVVAQGGKGGWGNSHFATSTRQIPRFAKPGLPGEQLEVELELKLLADVGLVGFPNVGKSTLITAVSAARPTIANYHFTTIVPVLGVVQVDDDESFIMADVPGLIQGASEGVGLGHQFLRHLDRCRLIVHLVDVSGSEGRSPIQDFETICQELERWDPQLAQRPMLVVASKCDLATQEQLEEFRAYIAQKGFALYEICAPIAQGTQELIYAIAQQLRQLPPILEYQPEPRPQGQRPIPGEQKKFDIRVEKGVYTVEADWLAYALGMVNPDDYESLQYLQRILRQSGIIDRLEELGIQEGDTVSILGFEFEYIP